MSRYRVIQAGPEEFVVQRKGWWWRDVYLMSYEGCYWQVCFRRADMAKEWITNTERDEAAKEARKQFKRVVVS